MEIKNESDNTPEFKDIKVLVAEDEPDNFQLINVILRKKDIEVIWAKNGQEAVDYIKNNPGINNCIVFMDIKMPVMDGYEANRQIKKINNKIPVIAVTAYAQQSDKQKIMDARFNDYISKPLIPETIINTIIKFKDQLPY